VVGRLAFPGGGEGGRVSRVLAVDRVAVRVRGARVALDAHVMNLRRAHLAELRSPVDGGGSSAGRRPSAGGDVSDDVSVRADDVTGNAVRRRESSATAEKTERNATTTTRARARSDTVIGRRVRRD